MFDDQSPTSIENTGGPVTTLPLARPSGQESSVRIVDDSDQSNDHSHRPVPPVAPGGMPYRYKVRLRHANAYASTADEVLSLFIDGYLATPPLGRRLS